MTSSRRCLMFKTALWLLLSRQRGDIQRRHPIMMKHLLPQREPCWQPFLAPPVVGYILPAYNIRCFKWRKGQSKRKSSNEHIWRCRVAPSTNGLLRGDDLIIPLILAEFRRFPAYSSTCQTYISFLASLSPARLRTIYMWQPASPMGISKR